MSRMAEKVRITRRDGRLHRVEVLDLEGNVLCELPLTGLDTYEDVQEPIKVGLIVHGTRVIFAEESDDREPNVVELPHPDDRVDDAQPPDPTVIPLPPRTPRPPGTNPWPWPLEPRIID